MFFCVQEDEFYNTLQNVSANKIDYLIIGMQYKEERRENHTCNRISNFILGLQDCQRSNMLLDTKYIEKCPYKERACTKILSGAYNNLFRGIYGKQNSGYYVFEVAKPLQ